MLFCCKFARSSYYTIILMSGSLFSSSDENFKPAKYLSPKQKVSEISLLFLQTKINKAFQAFNVKNNQF